ncbi:MAG: hypothetical protein V2A76_18615 [Planctomycetota bacterium]
MKRLPILLLALAPGVATAQKTDPPPPSLPELRQLIEQQREQNRSNEERIRALEALLKQLQSDQQQQHEEDELDELLRLAETSGPPPVARPSANPSLMNPSVSVIPEFVVRWGNVSIDGDPAPIHEAFPELFEETNPFHLHHTEIEFRAPVSPEADAVAIVGIGHEEVHVEEAYILFHSLPWGLAAKVGKFLVDFGRANRLHGHDLPQNDRPLVHRLLFGHEGFSSPGISLSKMLFTTPAEGLLPTYSELTVEAVNSMNDESPLLGEGADYTPAVNARWKNFWQLTPNADLEGGVSFFASPNGPSGLHDQTTALGADLTWRWDDPEPGSPNAWMVQAEAIGSSVDVSDMSGAVDAVGGYLTVQNQFDPQWYAGVRLDAAQSPTVEDASILGVSPYLTHYLNEFIRLRLQYDFRSADAASSSATSHGLVAQLVWVFGAHPPHPYWVNR